MDHRHIKSDNLSQKPRNSNREAYHHLWLYKEQPRGQSSTELPRTRHADHFSHLSQADPQFPFSADGSAFLAEDFASRQQEFPQPSPQSHHGIEGPFLSHLSEITGFQDQSFSLQNCETIVPMDASSLPMTSTRMESTSFVGHAPGMLGPQEIFWQLNAWATSSSSHSLDMPAPSHSWDGPLPYDPASTHRSDVNPTMRATLGTSFDNPSSHPSSHYSDHQSLVSPLPSDAYFDYPSPMHLEPWELAQLCSSPQADAPLQQTHQQARDLAPMLHPQSSQPNFEQISDTPHITAPQQEPADSSAPLLGKRGQKAGSGSRKKARTTMGREHAGNNPTATDDLLAQQTSRTAHQQRQLAQAPVDPSPIDITGSSMDPHNSRLNPSSPGTQGPDTARKSPDAFGEREAETSEHADNPAFPSKNLESTITEFIQKKSSLAKKKQLDKDLIQDLRCIVLNDDLYKQARNMVKSAADPEKKHSLLRYLVVLGEESRRIKREIDSGIFKNTKEFFLNKTEKQINKAIESGEAKDRQEFHRNKREKEINKAIELGKVKDRQAFHRNEHEKAKNKAIELGKVKDRQEFHHNMYEKQINNAIISGKVKDRKEYNHNRCEKQINNAIISGKAKNRKDFFKQEYAKRKRRLERISAKMKENESNPCTAEQEQQFQNTWEQIQDQSRQISGLLDTHVQLEQALGQHDQEPLASAHIQQQLQNIDAQIAHLQEEFGWYLSDFEYQLGF